MKEKIKITHCIECGSKLKRGSLFCSKCGVKVKQKKKIDKELFLNYDWDISTTEPPKKKSIFRKIFKGLGYGGVFVGGGVLFLLFNILHFLFYVGVGLLMIGWAISLFMKGSIIWGLVVLLLGTPIAVAIAQVAFIPILILFIIIGIIWGLLRLVGFSFSFEQVGGGAWMLLKLFIIGGMFVYGVVLFREAAKEKNIKGFFKEHWWAILLFCFLFWLFFL